MATRASLSQKPTKGTPQPSAGTYQAWSGKGMATPRYTRRQALDDDNSEQRHCFSHPSRATASRAAPCSSHSSGAESGRERRRKGKLKMKQQLDAALLRVSALEERNRCLLAIVAQLTPADATAEMSSGHSRPPAIFFDLFNDHIADAETQTDISVDFNKPDIFIYLSQQGLECPQQSHAADTACADAAAGAGPGTLQQPCDSQDLAYQGERLPIRPNSAQPGAGSYQAWSGKGMATPREKRRQALDDDNSEQRRGFASPVILGASSHKFVSQNLANTCGPLPPDTPPELLVSLTCPPGSSSPGDQKGAVNNLAYNDYLKSTCDDQGCTGQIAHSPGLAPPSGQLPTEESTEPLDATSMLFESYQCEPLPTCPTDAGMAQPGADAYQAWSGKGMATPGGLHELLNHTSCSGTAAHDTSQDLGQQVLKLGCGPLPRTESVAHDSEEQNLKVFNSQNLAFRCEPLPITAVPTEHASPVLLDATADVLTVDKAHGSHEHRVLEEQSLKDFNSQNLANTTLSEERRQALDDDNSEQRRGFAEKSLTGFNSQNPANISEPLPFTAVPTEHASPVLLDANADGSDDHPVKDEQSLKDFNSHQLACEGETLSDEEQAPITAAASSQQAVDEQIAALKARIAALRPLVENRQPSQQELRIRYEQQQRELKARRRKGKGKGKGARS